MPERVQEQGGRGDEGLALTGLHLGDVAFVEDDRAHHLDVEHPLPRLASGPRGWPRSREQLVQRLAVRQPLTQPGRGLAQLVVERLWKSGSSSAMYAACWARRFSRRPSPIRRTFSSLPKSVVGIEVG